MRTKVFPDVGLDQFCITVRYHPWWEVGCHIRIEYKGSTLRVVKVYHKSWFRKWLHKWIWPIKTMKLKVEYV